MSGFENFQSSDNWLNRFRNFLLEKRSVSPQMDSPNSSDPTIDFDQDFQEILEEKCQSIKLSHENKENCTALYNKVSKPRFFTSKDSQFNDSMIPMSPNRKSNCFEITANDSFFYLEKICNKTISDPDSTIHSYIENMRKGKSISLENDTTRDLEENDTIKKLNVSDIDGNYLPERTIFHVGDQTQLGDIEAPSGIWDTTISDAVLLQMSPTKRVGLLRPSTILEEPNSSYSGSEISDSSAISYKTAAKNSETTSYDTANDTIHSEIMKRKNNNLDEDKSIKDSAFYNISSYSEQGKTNSDQFSGINTLDDLSSLLDDSLNNYSKSKIIDKDSLEMEKSLNDTNKELSNDQESIIAISDEEDNIDNEDNELNKGFSLQSIDDEDNSDLLDETLSDSNANGINVSRVFNDTFEEVDYLLKQGMKKMTSTQPITIKNSSNNSSTLNIYTPSPKKTPKTPNTVISKQFSIKKLNPSSKSDRKDVFKKPSNYVNSRIPQPKTLLNVKKINPYSNIISPVGAYIKNTPKTPIISNIRETTVKSLDFGQLPKTTTLPFKQQLFKNNPKGQSSLPKKAYQSAEYREVRDERTPLNIPGGNKIHKYLQSALLPSVARHEGKMKIMKSSSVYSYSDDKSTGSHQNRTVDSSLADLSVMSGDVSVYTIRDAQKFE